MSEHVALGVWHHNQPQLPLKCQEDAPQADQDNKQKEKEVRRYSLKTLSTRHIDQAGKLTEQIRQPIII